MVKIVGILLLVMLNGSSFANISRMCDFCGQDETSTIPPNVDAEILLAVDISNSIDFYEYDQQQLGYKEALVSKEFIDVVEHGAKGEIAIAYIEWEKSIKKFTGWYIIKDLATAIEFANKITPTERSISATTAMSTMLVGAIELFKN